MRVNKFDTQYRALLQDLIQNGHKEMNQRTGVAVLALPNKVLSFDLSDNILPVTNLRRVYVKTAAAEAAWTILGDKDLAWLQKYTKMWDGFKDEKNEVSTAYGYRWKKHFGRDQLFQALHTLKTDPSNRQVVILAWDPGLDGLGNYHASNVPCPIGFVLNVIGGKLNMTLVLRSSDAIVGLPYDTMTYALLMKAIQVELFKSLGCTMGNLTLILSHSHIYECHLGLVQEMLNTPPQWFINLDGQNVEISQEVTMPDYGVVDIMTDPDEYMEYVIALVQSTSLLSPNILKPEIVK